MHKHTPRALGLSLMAALGLMAFMAGSAQAETAVPIKVLGSELEASVTGEGGLGRLLVPTLKAEIHCVKSKVATGTVLKNGIAHVTVLFEECLEINSYDPTTGKLLEKLPCLIVNGGEHHHITANALVTALLHKGTVYAIAEGSGTEQLFVEIKFKTGEGCTLPNPVKVKGTYGFTMSQGEVEKVALSPGGTAAATEALQTLLKKELKFGVNKAFLIEGAATAELTGAHAGCTWGAI